LGVSENNFYTRFAHCIWCFREESLYQICTAFWVATTIA
jgi:hypothetical protein